MHGKKCCCIDSTLSTRQHFVCPRVAGDEVFAREVIFSLGAYDVFLATSFPMVQLCVQRLRAVIREANEHTVCCIIPPFDHLSSRITWAAVFRYRRRFNIGIKGFPDRKAVLSRELCERSVSCIDA